jgi:chlorite dismutase
LAQQLVASYNDLEFVVRFEYKRLEPVEGRIHESLRLVKASREAILEKPVGSYADVVHVVLMDGLLETGIVG